MLNSHDTVYTYAFYYTPKVKYMEKISILEVTTDFQSLNVQPLNLLLWFEMWITIEYYRPRKWSDMDLASFCPFGWRLGAGNGPVSRGDNPQTAHLATRIKSFIVIKPRFEGDGCRGTWRCRAVVMSHFPSRVWGRKLELAMYMDHNHWGRETIHQ